VGAATVRERPLTVAYGTGSLFGVLSEPVGVPPAGLSAVLLNAGAIRRIGPNRMWVEIARRWAAQGVTALRLDLEGIGDASGDGERYTDVSELYVPEFVAQVKAALDALEARGAPGRCILLGLCSGAYWAFHTSLDDTRVAATVMLNPRVLYWHPDLDSERDARNVKRQFFEARSWRKTLRGENPMNVRRVAALARRIASRSRPPAAVLASDMEQAFDTLRDAGGRAVFVFCDGEPLREELDENGLLPPSKRWPNLELRLIPGRDHTLRPLWMHEHVYAAVDEAFAEELRRAR
jgi:hypothetical protein